MQFRDAFALIFDCPEIAAVLRQTVLQFAVRERLVSQDERDKPVNVLVEKVLTARERFIRKVLFDTLRGFSRMSADGNKNPFS